LLATVRYCLAVRYHQFAVRYWSFPFAIMFATATSV
jgi:hypothetical protein